MMNIRGKGFSQAREGRPNEDILLNLKSNGCWRSRVVVIDVGSCSPDPGDVVVQVMEASREHYGECQRAQRPGFWLHPMEVQALQRKLVHQLHERIRSRCQSGSAAALLDIAIPWYSNTVLIIQSGDLKFWRYEGGRCREVTHYHRDPTGAITHYVGAAEQPKYETISFNVNADERWLIATDGLPDAFPDDFAGRNQIAPLLAAHADPLALIQAVRDKLAHLEPSDDVTVIAMTVEMGEEAHAASSDTSGPLPSKASWWPRGRNGKKLAAPLFDRTAGR